MGVPIDCDTDAPPVSDLDVTRGSGPDALGVDVAAAAAAAAAPATGSDLRWKPVGGV